MLALFYYACKLFLWRLVLINVLSLFNGYSGSHLVLKNIGVETGVVYYSEIDKWANIITDKHFPEDMPLGSICNWRGWNIDWSSIDLIIGGSPCQGFSSSGKNGGTKAILDGVEYVVSDRETYILLKEKGANFLSQSHLFWEYVLCLDLVKTHNDNVKFLLENVEMTKNNEDMISKALGVSPVRLNSSACSPQSRVRNYWCNWEVCDLETKNICVADILENNIGDRACEIRGVGRNTNTSSGLIHVATATDIKGMECIKRVYDPSSKCPTITTMGGGHREPKFLMGNGLYRKATILELERLAGLSDGYTKGVSSTQRKKLIGNGWEIRTMEHVLKCGFVVDYCLNMKYNLSLMNN